MSPRSAYNDLLEQFAEAVADRVAAKIGATTPAPGDRKLVSVKEAAELMGVSEKAFRHQMNTKDFPERAIRRFGRKILIEKVTLERWLAAH